MAVLVISYARVDRPLVRGLVSLLRAGLQGIDKTVFWDDDFEPGEPWFAQIAVQIEDCAQLFVFWCRHSADSPQVARELALALARGKRVIPVLVDDTPLNESLAPIQGIDLRNVVEHSFAPTPKNVHFKGYIPPRMSGRHADPDDPLRRFLTAMTDVTAATNLSKWRPLLAEFAKNFAESSVVPR
jgi:hypothetical protein